MNCVDGNELHHLKNVVLFRIGEDEMGWFVVHDEVPVV